MSAGRAAHVHRRARRAGGRAPARSLRFRPVYRAEPLRDLRVAAGLTLAAAALACGVTVRTFTRWERGRAPILAHQVLGWHAHGVPIVASGFAGFRFGPDGRLYTPEGAPISAGELRALPYTRALIADYQRRQAPGAQGALF